MLNFFTKEQIDEIKRKLYLNNCVDIAPTCTIGNDDSLTIVQDGVTKRIKFSDLFNSKPFQDFLDESRVDLTKQINKWTDELDNFEHDINEKVDTKLKEVQQAINSLVKHGAVVSTSFGNSNDIGVSQKTLTEAINSIWKKLEQITGEPATGIDLTVTPDHFIAEKDCVVHISATHATNVFEHIKFYVDDVLVTEAKNVKEYHYDTTIDKTCEIKCVASILGIEYMDKKTVTKYFPFFIGSGSKWDDIVKSANARPFDGNIKGEYDVKVENEDDHIFIIIPASLKDQIVRADMNGFEIPFTITNTDEYIIYSSDNTYRKGVYGIDLTANCVCPC